MRIVDLIRKKRDGQQLTREEIQFIVRGYTESQFPDYQMSAWLMAVLLRGMSAQEIATLTEAMLHSGVILIGLIFQETRLINTPRAVWEIRLRSFLRRS